MSILGAGLRCCCLLFNTRCKAIKRPIIVTIKADNFIIGVITMIGVLVGDMFMVINRPAKILPHASRLIGLITSAGVSSIGRRGAMRVVLRETRKMSRTL